MLIRWWVLTVAERNLSGRLQQSIVAYAALGTLLVGTIVAVVSMVPLYQHLKQDREQNLLLQLEAKGQAVEDYLGWVEEIVTHIAHQTQVREQLEAGNKRKLNRQEWVNFSTRMLANTLEQIPGLVGVTRLDRENKLVVRVGLPIPAEFWEIEGNELAAIAPTPLQLGNKFYLVIATPIINAQSQRVGTDLVAFEIQRLQQIVEDFQDLEKNWESELARIQHRKIEPLFPSQNNRTRRQILSRKDTNLGAAIGTSIKAKTGWLQTQNTSGRSEAIAYRLISNSNWLLVVKISPTEFYAPIDREIGRAAGAIGFLLFLTTCGTIVLLRPLAGKTLIHTDELERLLQENTATLQSELLERKRTERLLASHARESATIAGLGQWALAGIDIATLMEEAATHVTQTLAVDYCSLWELLEGGKELCLRSGSGWPEDAIGKAIVNADSNSHAGYTLKVNEPVIVEDLHQECRFIPSELFQTQGIVSGLAIVVQGHDRPFGVLAAHSTEKRKFGRDAVYFLQAIANVLATAIERKQHESALRESEERYALAVAGANDGLWDWNLNANTVYFSPRWKSLLGYEVEEIGDRPEEWFKRIHPEDVENVRAAIADHLAGVTPHFKSEHRILDADGNYRWILSRGLAVRDRTGQPYRMAGSQTDISDRKATEEQNIRLAAFPKYNPNPVLACDREGEIVYVNPATEQVLEQLRIGLATGFLPVNHRELVRSSFKHTNRGWQVERIIQDRVFCWLYHPIPSLQIVHIHVMDITDRQKAEEQLRHEALHDSLTGLPNRTLFLQRLDSALIRAKEDPDCYFAVVFLDLDRFKVVNDSLGHFIGDRLLIAFASRLQKCIGPTHILARFGGDEFTLLLENIQDISDAIHIADRIHTELASPFNLDGYEVFTTASIGIAPGWFGYQRSEELLRDADIAMYRAKARGRSRHEVFDRRMLDRVVALLNLENDLRRAILKDVEIRNNHGHSARRIADKTSTLPRAYGKAYPTGRHRDYHVETSEFILQYQPIVSLDTGLLSGFEALVRWQHPERGLISPAEFIPVAEETGLIVPLGEWVLREACLQMRQWQALSGNPERLSISVNLSGQQLGQVDLIARIDRILEETHLPPSSLKLEITESVLMENATSAAELLDRLRSRHIHLCIDDFGTGYSSLSHLAQFPINTLKIDKSFVMGMHVDNENSEIVRAIAMLAHNLGMYVTAEGVEKEEHLVQLWALHCDYGQGYFFSPALDKEEAEALLKRSPRW